MFVAAACINTAVEGPFQTKKGKNLPICYCSILSISASCPTQRASISWQHCCCCTVFCPGADDKSSDTTLSKNKHFSRLSDEPKCERKNLLFAAKRTKALWWIFHFFSSSPTTAAAAAEVLSVGWWRCIWIARAAGGGKTQHNTSSNVRAENLILFCSGILGERHLFAYIAELMFGSGGMLFRKISQVCSHHHSSGDNTSTNSTTSHPLVCRELFMWKRGNFYESLVPIYECKLQMADWVALLSK